jgi:hypothetical protein
MGLDQQIYRPNEGSNMAEQKRHRSIPSAEDALPGGGSLPNAREQLGKVGGSLMILAASAALTFFIYVAAQGEPPSHKGEQSLHLVYPLWPYLLCAGILAAGGLVYGWAHRCRLPHWETRRVLRRRVAEVEKRATVAEIALAGARDQLGEARKASSAPESESLRLLLVDVIHYRQW